MKVLAPEAPEPLRALCARCMARDAGARPAEASEVVDALQAWLEGAARRERAARVMADAQPLPEEARKRREAAEALRAQAGEALADVQPWDPVDNKRPGWALEARAEEAEREATVIEARYEQGVRAALELDPQHRPALDALAELYKARLVRAEAQSDEGAAARYTTLLASHDGGRHAAWLRGDGAVTLVTDPPGATVLLETYEPRDRRLVAVPQRELGRTPLVEVRLPRGSHRLRIRREGHAEVPYPVAVGRGEHWHGVPPEGSEALPIRLPREGELGPDDCYVPAGWFTAGGDPQATDGWPERRQWVEGFVMRRFPVTNTEYVAFLNELESRGQPDEAALLEPRATGDGAAIYLREADGARRVPHVDAAGMAWGPRWPVVLVSWRAAARYAAWSARRSGQPWQLPHEVQWEKGARGVDARAFPWGDRFDPSFACTAHSTAQGASPCEVSAFPTDESPYGIRGLGGNVRDWCANPYRRASGEDVADDLRVVRGGLNAASAPSQSRCAGRLVGRPDQRSPAFGFRLARPLPRQG